MPHSVHDSSTAMSRPSSTSTNSANVFPKPAGLNLAAPEPIGGGDALSPSRSTFSFDSSPKSPHISVDRVAIFEETQTATARLQSHGTRKRAQYYEDKFAYKDDSTSSARERVTKDAPVIADLRTNVIIKDEYTLVTDLSHHLSQRYQRPESSIMITVNHSACLLLGGSFEPTYVLSISALPTQVQPTTNKRNAALIQNFMFESLGVHKDRGIIKFCPIQEECLAINGNTVLGEIETLERQQADETASGLRRALTKNSKRSMIGKAKSSMQLSRNNSQAVQQREAVTPPLPSPGPFDSGVEVNEKVQDQFLPLPEIETATSKDDTMLPLSKKSETSSRPKTAATKSSALPTPPPIPKDGLAPKIAKRKSFMTIFKR